MYDMMATDSIIFQYTLSEGELNTVYNIIEDTKLVVRGKDFQENTLYQLLPL